MSQAELLQQQTIHNLHIHNLPILERDALTEITQGLERSQKQISPKFFYDAEGSRLFDAITQLPEYYPTRTEQQIFSLHRDAIRQALRRHKVVVEPGSGNGDKGRLLLRIVGAEVYVPVEICESHVVAASQRLAEEFPSLEVHAVCADFTQAVDLPDGVPAGARAVFFPGSTIGNFEPTAAIELLKTLRRWAGEGGSALIGVDCKKEHSVLNSAYNDRQGVTAAFNRNMLSHINNLTGSDFVPEQFEHHAFYNEKLGRIEMHLRSLRQQEVNIQGHRFEFALGESIHTESSYKYGVDEFADLAKQAGFEHQHCWQDPRGLFGVHCLRA